MSLGEQSARPPGSITIDQLLALNEEIAALVRAGVPLERGLVVAGRDLRGRLGRIAAALSRRLSRGESLPEALEGEGQSIPPLYRAVVEAGARSGRLPIALEGLAQYVRGYAEARAAIGLALWYPLLVLTLAYALFVGLVSLAVPAVRRGVRFAGPARGRSVALAVVGRRVGALLVAGRADLLFMLLIAWVRSGSGGTISGEVMELAAAFPVDEVDPGQLRDRQLLRAARALARAPRALSVGDRAGRRVDRRRAADSGRPSTGRGDRAGRIRRGGAGGDRPRNILAHDALGAGHGAGTGLAGRGPAQPRRCLPQARQYQAEKLAVFLPTILMIAIGASATLFYGLALFVPLTNLLRELTVP